MGAVYVSNKLYAYDLYRHIGYSPKVYLNDATSRLESDPSDIEALNTAAYSHYYMNDFYQALDYALRAYSLEKEQHFSDELYYTCNLLGNVYRFLGVYDSAASYYMTALELKPSYQIQEKRCTILRYLAITYTEMNIIDYAADYAIEALQLAELINDEKLLADVQVALCHIYLKTEVYKKALKLCDKSIESYKRLQDRKGLIRVYIIAGDLQCQTEQYDLSKIYYEKALFLSKEIAYNYGLINSNYALGQLLLKQDFTNRARNAMNEALRLAKRYTIQQPKVKIYYGLSALAERENDYESAYNLYKMATELNESLNSRQHRELLYELQNKHNLNQKEEQLQSYVEQNQTLAELNRQLRMQIQLDPLTQLYNRRGLKHLLTDFSFNGESALALCDIDKFKVINDTYGHQCGDYILIELAKVFKNLCPPSFKIARWGGEEFLIVMPNTTVTEAADFSNSLRERVEEIAYTYRQHQIRLTMTFGVSSLIDSFEQSVEIADKCLYFGKNSGRNKVIKDISLNLV